MAYSGRCLLSGYFNHRDSNQGACTNACRWKYNVKEGSDDEWGNTHVESVSHIFEQSPQREGEMNTLEEDEHGNAQIKTIHHGKTDKQYAQKHPTMKSLNIVLSLVSNDTDQTQSKRNEQSYVTAN